MTVYTNFRTPPPAKDLGEVLGVDSRTNWFVLLLFLDKILSLLFVFLIGLGLRNAFKMK